MGKEVLFKKRKAIMLTRIVEIKQSSDQKDTHKKKNKKSSPINK